MAIYKKGKEVSLVYYGKMAVMAIYRGTTLVYTAIRSCFGSGIWNNEKPWINEDGWAN